MDFPGATMLKPVIGTGSVQSLGPQMAARLGSATTPASAAWPTNNLAIFVPLVLPVPYFVRKVWWANGSAASGNVDCGVYTEGGALLLSCGSTAQGTINVVQSVTLGTPVLLEPGSYYMALVLSSTSGRTIRWQPSTASQGQLLGLAQQATALPLPASFTLASYAQTYIPLFGIARSLTI